MSFFLRFYLYNKRGFFLNFKKEKKLIFIFFSIKLIYEKIKNYILNFLGIIKEK